MVSKLKEQALAKMLEEMNKKHGPAEDVIHNWLCDQEDDELFQGILKDGYTIKSSLSYAKNKAMKFAQNGVACIDDETVFEWVREYFLANSSLENIKQVPVEPVNKSKFETVKRKGEAAVEKVDIGPGNDIVKKSKKSKQKGVAEGQLSLFADLV